MWSKSFLNARCRLCRKKGDGEKMLLCDGCDRGHHIYCLKPPMKVSSPFGHFFYSWFLAVWYGTDLDCFLQKIPEGDWYCKDCKPKDIMKTPRKTRRQSSTREEVDEESSDDESEEDDDDDEEEEEEEEQEDENESSDDGEDMEDVDDESDEDDDRDDSEESRR